MTDENDDATVIFREEMPARQFNSRALSPGLECSQSEKASSANELIFYTLPRECLNNAHNPASRTEREREQFTD